MLELGVSLEGMQLVCVSVILQVHDCQVLWLDPHAAVLTIEAYNQMSCIALLAQSVWRASPPVLLKHGEASIRV